jgi:thioredoxin-related protein
MRFRNLFVSLTRLPYPGSIAGALALLLTFQCALASDQPKELEAAADLRTLGQISASGNLVILLAATREGCSYCALLKREILVPMIRSGSYDDKVLIRELVFEPDTDLIDFDGRPVSSAELVARYAIEIAPTVLLLDHRGKTLHAPMKGINTVEMYGFYLDRAIDQALAGLISDPSAAPQQE